MSRQGGLSRLRAPPRPLTAPPYTESRPPPQQQRARSNFWQHFITDGGDFVHGPDPAGPDPREDEALDAYSKVVVRVAEMLRPAVVNLRSGQGRRQGSGSGILFTPDGFLLTNHHVVQGSERVRVRLTEGQELPGRLVGNDPGPDLAIV